MNTNYSRITATVAESTVFSKDEAVTNLISDILKNVDLFQPDLNTEVTVECEYERKGYPTRSSVNHPNPRYVSNFDELVVTVEFKLSNYRGDDIARYRSKLLEVTKETLEARDKAATDQRRQELEAQIASAQAELDNL